MRRSRSRRREQPVLDAVFAGDTSPAFGISWRLMGRISPIEKYTSPVHERNASHRSQGAAVLFIDDSSTFGGGSAKGAPCTHGGAHGTPTSRRPPTMRSSLPLAGT